MAKKKKFKEILKERFGGKYQVSYWETRPHKEKGEDVIYVGLSKAKLSDKEASELPTEVNDVKVIYEYTGEIKALTQGLYDPLVGGISMGAVDITAGTYGGVVYRNGEKFLLTNEHVVSDTQNTDPDHPPKGHKIVQPGKMDGGTVIAGNLIEVGGMKKKALRGEACDIDAAIIKPLRGVIDDKYYKLGTIDAYKHSDVEPGTEIVKVGRTTSVTYDKVKAVDVSANIGGIAWSNPVVMEGIIMTRTSFSKGGDSGSRVWRKDTMQPVGLVFAGSPVNSMIIPAETICRKFNVIFGDKEPEKRTSKSRVMRFLYAICSWLKSLF